MKNKNNQQWTMNKIFKFQKRLKWLSSNFWNGLSKEERNGVFTSKLCGSNHDSGNNDGGWAERKRPETFFFFSLAPWLAQFPVVCRDLSQKDRACLKNEKAVLAGGKNFLLIQARKRTRSEVIHAYFAMQYRGKYFSWSKNILPK